MSTRRCTAANIYMASYWHGNWQWAYEWMELKYELSQLIRMCEHVIDKFWKYTYACCQGGEQTHELSFHGMQIMTTEYITHGRAIYMQTGEVPVKEYCPQNTMSKEE